MYLPPIAWVIVAALDPAICCHVVLSSLKKTVLPIVMNVMTPPVPSAPSITVPVQPLPGTIPK